VSKDFLDEKTRAEDIILGSLGYGEEATLISVTTTEAGFEGIGHWDDGEEFSFESEEGVALDELEKWALSVLSSSENQAAVKIA
jgi:hypothetical protein